jgi:hypothetical protein
VAARTRQIERRLDEHAAYPTAAVGRLDGHVLDLTCAIGRALDQLEMSDLSITRDCDQHLAVIDVRVQLLRRVLGLLEQVP